MRETKRISYRSYEMAVGEVLKKQGINCPHYNSRTRGVPRRKDFRDMIRKMGGTGIAIENNCALEFVDGRYRVISLSPNARAYRVHRSGGVC